MPQPPGAGGQKSLFSFGGFSKHVFVNGVPHQVVTTMIVSR
jgi:hypothetical protein